ncbi:MAG TPA: energy transducer TonB [Clostridiales bacterium]|nr:energy transducer TonB [Clostridiales bacterium]HQP69029.1 energy transducer TonB [Clostridiales bacterium]
MNRKAIIVMIMLCLASFYAQSKNSAITGKVKTNSSTDLIISPQLLPESEKIVQDYISKNYPPLARKSGISGKVIVSFTCSKDGLAKNISIKLVKPVDMGFEEVAVKAVELFKMSPAKYKGENVEMEVEQKIDFNADLDGSYYMNVPKYKFREL